jgi:hypothetical protein
MADCRPLVPARHRLPGTRNPVAAIVAAFLLTACEAKIDDHTFKRIEPGMTLMQVLNLLGDPREITDTEGPASGRFSASWHDRHGRITLHFEDGRVLQREYQSARGQR